MHNSINSAIIPLLEGRHINNYPEIKERIKWIDNIEQIVVKFQEEFEDCISKDFSKRSKKETYLAEVLPTISAARNAKKNLKNWARSKKVTTSPIFWFGKSIVFPQPLGIVAIISPWNYPLQLSMIPAINALAAGNRVIIKPSEKTPHFSNLLKNLTTRYFKKTELIVLTGGKNVSESIAMCEKIDHIFFTGSTEVGKKIAKTAAENLIPTTLELGGKSPVYISESANLHKTLERVTTAKYINCGQTCIAPDYLIVHSKHESKFLETFINVVDKLYSSVSQNFEQTFIFNDYESNRMTLLEEDAVTKGAVAKKVNSMENSITLLLNCNDQMKVLNEEIFGYLLPVIFVKNYHEAISYINQKDAPLALYWFGNETKEQLFWMKNTKSGGVTINDCILHVAQDNLPFGGIGKSGQGHYHGVWGFENFSKLKPIFLQSDINLVNFFMPPYKSFLNKFAKFLKYIV